MKMNTDKEWLMKKAEQEDGCYVSAGGLVQALEQTQEAIMKDLKSLRSATEAAIKVVCETVFICYSDPVNWADLSCSQTAFVVTDRDEPYCEVTIEEASPDAVKFRQAVSEELEKAGWPGIRVVTEW